MGPAGNDFERHGAWFLERLRRVLSEFRMSPEMPLDDLVRRLDRLWPQVLTAFAWASAHQQTSEVAARAVAGLMEAADSGDLLQLRRGPAELRRWSDAVREAAEKSG